MSFFKKKTIIGHRGAAGYAPENTMHSFALANTLKAPCIEFDVMLSADNIPIVFHDSTLNRTTNGSGKVADQRAKELCALDAGFHFQAPTFRNRDIHVPTFAELLTWLSDLPMAANVEIKPSASTFTLETTIRVINDIQKYWKRDDFPLISSFDNAALITCKERMPSLPLGCVSRHWSPSLMDFAISLECVSIHIAATKLSKEIVHTIKSHPNDFDLCAYTVNDKKEAEKLFSWGVDAIFSDYPDLLTLE